MFREKKCICGVMEEINGFESMGEFNRFQDYINKLIKGKELLKSNVHSKYAESNVLQENWYKCIECKQKWRLVHPDFPFKGIWKKIKMKNRSTGN